MIENGFVDAGITGSTAVEKAWVSKGGRVIGETKSVPIKQFLASKKFNEADRTKLQAIMLAMSDSDAGRAVLAKIGITGFVPWNSGLMNEATARLGL